MKEIDKLLSLLEQYLSDGSLDVRQQAKRAILALKSVEGEKLLLKYFTRENFAKAQQVLEKGYVEDYAMATNTSFNTSSASFAGRSRMMRRGLSNSPTQVKHHEQPLKTSQSVIVADTSNISEYVPSPNPKQRRNLDIKKINPTIAQGATTSDGVAE